MKVYKFKSLSDSKINEVIDLINGQIFFSTAKNLNDPFEYASTYSFKYNFQDKLKFWKNDKELENTLNNISSLAQKNYIEHLESQLNSITEIIYSNESQGIFCTSKTWENLVLWSHYTDTHKGIVIEIETEGIDCLSHPKEVQYTRKDQTIPFYKSTHINEILKICSTKYKDWEYEKEIRFFSSPGIINIPPRNIKSIIFGMNSRMSNWTNYLKIVDEVRSKNSTCKIFEIVRNRTSFKLEKKDLTNTQFYGGENTFS